MTRFAFVGFGQLAAEFACGLRKAGLEDIRVSTRTRPDAAAEVLARRLEAAGVRALPLAEAVDAADVVLAAVPLTAAAQVAEECAPMLREGCLYIDVAPRPPAAKAVSAALLAERAVLYVDAAVLGTVLTEGFSVPILASGPGALQFRDLVEPLGMSVTAVEGPPGRASLVKLLRTVYMKGRDALILEMLLAARHHGVEDLLLPTIGGTGERVPFPELAERVLCSLALHAERRADELIAAKSVVEKAAVEPLMIDASAERLRRMADLGLSEHFGGTRPRDIGAVLRAIEAAERP